MSDVLEVLLSAFDEAYDRKGWHGPGLRGAVRRVPSEVAFWRPAKGRHNIWELTIHAAYWKYALRRRLSGGKRGSFALKGSNWIASPASEDEQSWRDAVALLDREHRGLREAIAVLSAKELRDPGRVRLVYGMTAHDLYHAGQIQLVKRLHQSEA
jgi:hypothetical protein